MFRHNVLAMRKKKNRIPTTEEALATAMRDGDKYYSCISHAITEAKAADKVKLLRWPEVEDDKMRQQQDVLHQHYEMGGPFAKKLDEIGKAYILLRRPQTTYIEDRLKHAVAYLIAELPVLLMGFRHQGQHYCTLTYPTTPQKAALMEANGLWDLLYEIQTFPEYAELRRDLYQVTKTENTHGTILLPIPELKDQHVQPNVKRMLEVDLNEHVQKHNDLNLVTEKVQPKFVGLNSEKTSSIPLRLSFIESEKHIA